MKKNAVLLKSCDCSNKLSTFTQEVHGLTPYCSAVHDGIMCWPATPPGIMVAQHCPPLPGFIVEMLVYRKCSENGAWQHFNDSFVVIEKTNFESCLQTVATQPQEYDLDYITQVSDVIRKTNILGMVFVLLSLLSIVISIILYKFILPKYINDILRIKIHKHLFAAVSFDMLLKFIFQISLLLSINNSDPGLLQKPVICEILITLNQYSETTILLWTVIDCHFIYVLARSGLLCISGYLVYIIIGWGTPLIPTLIWAMTLHMSHKVKMKNNTVLLESFDCSNKLSTFTQEVHGLMPYCSAVHDGIMCWPATPPGITVAQHCPHLPGFNVEMLVYRKCSENGAWQHFNDSFVVIEKTNFESCLQTVATQPQEYGLDYITQVSDVIRKTNILGMVFVLLSLLSIVISIILYKFILPKYINDILRIKIHKHLFAAVSFDMLLKFIFQISLLLSFNNSDPGLLQKPVICEILITLNQYSETTILLWTVIDCHFIHVSARSGLLCISGYLAYIIIGWGTPLIPTLIWAMTLHMSHKVSCWQGHVNLTSIWIVEVPKMVCLVAILMFICMSSYRHYQTVSQHSNTHPKTISNLLTTTIMFVLLLLTFLVITIPTHIKIDNLQHKIIIQYIATILTSSKGIYVILLCNYSNIKDYVRPEPSNTDIEF